uniref:P-type phospholipid transporter n=1 Tax=Steinernema glaseri TaxID=37863 RepID=A0A1I8ABE9_9BILA
IAKTSQEETAADYGWSRQAEVEQSHLDHKVQHRHLLAAFLIRAVPAICEHLLLGHRVYPDGESNLKIRQAVTATFSLTSEDHIKNFVNAGAQLTYEPPSGAIYDFAGVISINSLDAKGTQQRRNYPLGLGQLLPRGAKLKNTEWAYGIAVYTGKATKLMMNMTHTPTKRSGVDKITNHIMMVQFGLLGVISVIAAFAGVVWLNYRIDTHWYLPFESPLSYKLERLPLMLLILGQVTLYAGLIPISLYIYLAMARQAQAFFIRNDIEMYHEHNDTKAEV